VAADIATRAPQEEEIVSVLEDSRAHRTIVQVHVPDAAGTASVR
jgi:hypothetical protein